MLRMTTAMMIFKRMIRMAETWKRKWPEVKFQAETNPIEIGIHKMPGMVMTGKMVAPTSSMTIGRIRDWNMTTMR